jgi:hypothetical protein
MQYPPSKCQYSDNGNVKACFNANPGIYVGAVHILGGWHTAIVQTHPLLDGELTAPNGLGGDVALIKDTVPGWRELKDFKWIKLSAGTWTSTPDGPVINTPISAAIDGAIAERNTQPPQYVLPESNYFVSNVLKRAGLTITPLERNIFWGIL